MSKIPDTPFLTKRFGPEGGGIDFLGMRRENLRILTDYLIPGINNATADFGTFCVAAWIPWKFRELSHGKDQYTRSQYNKFREAVEIAFAYSIRNDSPSNATFGVPRLRIGVQQKVDLAKPMTFASAGRTEATSLFAAPLYGPALRYVKLIAGEAMADDLTSTGIPLSAPDELTQVLVKEVEASLQSCPEVTFFTRPDGAPVTGETLDQLGLHGLNPSYYRSNRPEIKKTFLRKFLVSRSPKDQADYRRLTARLICETIRQHEFKGEDELRACWYTGLLPTGQALKLVDDELVQHQEKWALFHARQVQRTISETLLRCFEMGLRTGAQKISEVIEHWRKTSPTEFRIDDWTTLDDFIRAEAASVSGANSFVEVSRAWHEQVHGLHPQYDDLPEGEIADELWRAMRMLARWWIRMQRWLTESQHPDFLQFGGRARMSLQWFADWLTARLSQPLASILEDCFSDIVFSQHIKVALSRFDGQVQRLRFTLGDSGIIPTVAAAAKLGQAPVRMADRLTSFLGLLTDLDVIERKDGEPLRVGRHANFTVKGV